MRADKRSFAPADQSTPQYEQKLLLEEQHRAALSKYRTHRLEQSELEEEMSRMADQLADLEETRVDTSSQLMDLSDKSDQLDDQLQQHVERQTATKAQVQRLIAEHRRNAQTPPGVQSDIELEAAVVEQRATNRVLFAALAKVAATDQQLAMSIEAQIAEAGLQPPAADIDLDEDDAEVYD